jgi:hypothetical protein
MQSTYSLFTTKCRKLLVWTIMKEPVSLAWMIWMRYYIHHLFYTSILCMCFSIVLCWAQKVSWYLVQHFIPPNSSVRWVFFGWIEGLLSFTVSSEVITLHSISSRFLCALMPRMSYQIVTHLFSDVSLGWLIEGMLSFALIEGRYCIQFIKKRAIMPRMEHQTVCYFLALDHQSSIDGAVSPVVSSACRQALHAEFVYFRWRTSCKILLLIISSPTWSKRYVSSISRYAVDFLMFHYVHPIFSHLSPTRFSTVLGSHNKKGF